MSKHHRHKECCYPMAYGYGGYPVGSYKACTGTNTGIQWIYALLILIVIVLQFGKDRSSLVNPVTKLCEDDGTAAVVDGLKRPQLIDNSILFIIIVFLLVICSGCLGSGSYSCRGGYGY
ncbi:MAG: hypothetical protein QME45_06390 [Clostridiales bacterium]|nr:hypothetical protein [Clostridiales bacterium]HBM80787.1 hypothetical protein [Clostridiaceae bacterium]